MKKIYTLANMAKGMMLAALLAVGTTALAQNVSGNTESGTVEGTENGSNENETFAPAAESSWLQPVKLVGNGQKAYIYNVATGTFITGKTATVKNIKDADVWTINGDKTRCFTCDNETKDHLFLGYIYIFPVHQWHAEVSSNDKRTATDFTIVEDSTKNSYKLTKYKKITLNGPQTAYFSVSGDRYVASLEPSIDNDWYFISADQKDVYTEYTSLFTEAANLLKNEKLNDQESVLGAIKTALQEETAKGTFDTSNADINTLKTTIAAAKKAIEDITNGISNTSDNLKNAEITSIYSANGTRKAQLTKGINIVKMSNGAVKKILVK